MKIPYVRKINSKDIRSVSLKDLSELGGTSVNAVVDKTGKIIKFAFMGTEAEKINKKVLSIISVGDKVFYYAEDGKLYCVYNGALITPQLKAFSSSPTIVEIMKNGKYVPFVIDGIGNGYAINEDGTVTEHEIPKGRVATVYNGMLFIANNNEVYFSAPLDFTDFTMDLNHGGLIKTDVNDGEIRSLVTEEDKLLIFTTRAVYTFTAFGDRIDYELKKLETVIPSMRTCSAKDCGEKIVFVSDDSLYAYSQGKITKIDGLLDGKNYKPISDSAVDDGVYYLPVTDANGKKSILRHDLKSGLECLLDTGKSLIADGGYSVSDNGSLLKLEENSLAETTVSFTGKPFDFGSAKKKVVHEISVICSSQGTLTIDGDCGQKKFSLERGGNEKRMNISSKTFVLTFSGGKDFNAKNLTIKYRIKGE